MAQTDHCDLFAPVHEDGARKHCEWRIVANALALVMLAAPPSAHSVVHQRWAIKTSVPSDKSLTHGTSTDLSTLMGLPDVPGVTHSDQRYDAKRIPTPVGGHKEGEVLVTKGYLLLVAKESDGDYHIQVSDKPGTTASNTCLIVEIPPNVASLNANAGTRDLAGPMRQWVRDKLLKGKAPGSGGNLMRHPPYVRITGQLFYDDSHVGTPPRGRRGIKASTLWELHPVTVMAFTPKP